MASVGFFLILLVSERLYQGHIPKLFETASELVMFVHSRQDCSILSAENKENTDATSNAEAVTRLDRIGAVFRECDADNDGWLNLQEMHRFACHTGFDGNDVEWAEVSLGGSSPFLRMLCLYMF